MSGDSTLGSQCSSRWHRIYQRELVGDVARFDGIGMHEGFLPGYPASHGCIRMPGFMSERFFENVGVGTPVTISP